MRIVSNGDTAVIGDGLGVPPGGIKGQILVKASDSDYDTKWMSPGDLGDVPELEPTMLSL